jgi:WD40 repeat protein
VFSVQFNSFSGNDGAGEFWAVGDKMVKSCDTLARSCSKGIFGGNGVLQSALCVTFSSSPAFVVTGMADGDIYFWSAGSLITANHGAHAGGVTSVTWFNQLTEKGPTSRLASGGKDGYLRIWDMSDRGASLTATLHSTSAHPFPLISRFPVAQVLPRSLGPRAAVVSLDYNQERDRLAVGLSKNALFVVELSAFIPAASPPTADAPAAQRALSSNSASVLLSGHSGEIGALATVVWKGQQCALTGAMDGSVRSMTPARRRHQSYPPHAFMQVRLWDMRERKELATGQLPAPIRCIHCSYDGSLVAFGHSSGLLSVFKASDFFESSASLAGSQAAPQSADSGSMFWRSQPGTVTTGSLFAPSMSSSQVAASKVKPSSSKSKSSATASACASELLAVPGCVYAGIHRRENITDVKFSPCGMCVRRRLRLCTIYLSFSQVFSVSFTG